MIIEVNNRKATRGTHGVFESEMWGELVIREKNLEIHIPQSRIRKDGLVKKSTQALLNEGATKGFDEELVNKLSKNGITIIGGAVND